MSSALLTDQHMNAPIEIGVYGIDPATKLAFPPHPTQQRILDWCDRVRAGQHPRKGIPVLYVQHGVNSGGTRGMLAPVLEYLLEEPGLNVLIGRKTFLDLRKSAMRTFFDIIPPSVIVKRNEQEHWYDLAGPRGTSRVYFSELANWTGKGSQEYAVIVVVEAHELSSEATYRILKQRCRQGLRPSFLLLEGNPPTEGHWLTNLVNQHSPSYDPDLEVWELSSHENWQFMTLAYREMLQAMPVSWQRRYLFGKSGFLPTGTPVYPSFIESVHSRATSLVPDRPILRGWDFGYRRAGCIWSQKTDDGQVLVHKEWMPIETPESEFIDGVIQRTNEWFGSLTCVDYGDPAARNRDPEGISTLNRLTRAGIRMKYRQTTYADRIPLINQRLSMMIRGAPSVVVDPVGCPILTQGLLGGYHYPTIDPDRRYTTKMEIPDHDQWFSHLANCLRGDMRVRTLRGYKPIQEIASGEWVWSWHEQERRMVPARILARLDRGEQPTYKLLHDHGAVYATPEHQICLRDGTFVPLERLQAGDELMPFHEWVKSGGKYRIVNLNDGSSGEEHRVVYARLKGHLRQDFQVDHRNNDTFDNDPSNLQLLSQVEHGQKSVRVRGNDGPCEECGKSLRGIRRQRWCSATCRMRVVRREKPDYYTAEKQRQRRAATAQRGPYWWRRSPAVNHSVMSIEPAGVARVYDLAVEGEWTHNFVCEGLVVHNCFEYLMVNLFFGMPTPTGLLRRQERLMGHALHQPARTRGVVSF